MILSICPFSYLDPRCMVGRIYGTTSCGYHDFREDFLKFFPHFKSIEAYDSMASRHQEHGWQDLCRWPQSKKMAKIRKRYNQAPHLTQDTNGKVTTSQLDITNVSQEVSPFSARDHRASIDIRARKHNKNKTEIT